MTKKQPPGKQPGTSPAIKFREGRVLIEHGKVQQGRIRIKEGAAQAEHGKKK